MPSSRSRLPPADPVGGRWSSIVVPLPAPCGALTFHARVPEADSLLKDARGEPAASLGRVGEAEQQRPEEQLPNGIAFGGQIDERFFGLGERWEAEAHMRGRL